VLGRVEGDNVKVRERDLVILRRCKIYIQSFKSKPEDGF
jgi:hypothetical protein